ncbi:transposase [Candidatus Woesearchaeota archaeon]|jgi:aspartyl/asparaginyl-tRNA synthetase|nr:transposase [Candidatus Woesearchaeota archaeon]MBT4322146.1 transposase [Candidatus Woesearchaeota archaeon]MBT4630982.1 transposase [Candidatus Woesearchaeota archaeon]
MENIKSFSYITERLRSFFQGRMEFVEVPAQSRLSILAACEDPSTISPFIFGGVKYPLPQTGQMWLEYELLKNPDISGVFCQTTSYRDEPNPKPGRHDKVFPMFEFEARGDMEDLKKLESELLIHLGFPKPVTVDYEEMCEKYKVNEVDDECEERIGKDYGTSVILERFPLRSHPFWNMKHHEDGIFNKVDILLHGMETTGGAERSTNVDEMRENFLSISDGEYSKLLFDKFGEKRVMEELEDYLSLPMFPRFGTGIGITRLERAMNLSGLLK